MNAQIVVGLGFGDEGKGIATDYLCSQNENSLVVRFSGGQQCGHNVCMGEKSHVHSNFGSGTLRGVPSFFTEHCTFYPVTMFNELLVLKKKNVSPKISLHPLTKLTTPFDVIANRVLERKNNHGSCGLGIGTTMKRDERGYKLFAADLENIKLLKIKFEEIRKYYKTIDDLTKNDQDWLEEELENFYAFLPHLPIDIDDYNLLKSFPNLIFEGSQGIMLDQNHGIFPHVTFANTTSKNAIELCEKLGIKNREVFYVTRCYSTRHGYGWMPNEEKIELNNNEAEINVFNEHQKDFRIGEIDYGLLNYALKVDGIYSNDCERNLVVTCLDQRENFQFDYSKLQIKFKEIYESRSPDSIQIKNYFKFMKFALKPQFRK
ncbi:MAG: adenylosuccinate synthetase [Pyrinomonadaceae bacterium]|nr:adenylosuccinate synthetase [Pyrinomonadaceae bacterium]